MPSKMLTSSWSYDYLRAMTREIQNRKTSRVAEQTYTVEPMPLT